MSVWCTSHNKLTLNRTFFGNRADPDYIHSGSLLPHKVFPVQDELNETIFHCNIFQQIVTHNKIAIRNFRFRLQNGIDTCANTA